MNPKYKNKNTVASTSDRPSNRAERHKYLFELMKHMTTLSSGSVLLLVTFLEKVSHGKPPGTWVMFAFGGFCFSIIGSISLMAMFASIFGEKLPEKDRIYFSIMSLMAIGGFMTGMLCLMNAAYRSY